MASESRASQAWRCSGSFLAKHLLQKRNSVPAERDAWAESYALALHYHGTNAALGAALGAALALHEHHTGTALAQHEHHT